MCIRIKKRNLIQSELTSYKRRDYFIKCNEKHYGKLPKEDLKC